MPSSLRSLESGADRFLGVRCAEVFLWGWVAQIKQEVQYSTAIQNINAALYEAPRSE